MDKTEIITLALVQPSWLKDQHKDALDSINKDLSESFAKDYARLMEAVDASTPGAIIYVRSHQQNSVNESLVQEEPGADFVFSEPRVHTGTVRVRVSVFDPRSGQYLYKPDRLVRTEVRPVSTAR